MDFQKHSETLANNEAASQQHPKPESLLSIVTRLRENFISEHEETRCQALAYIRDHLERYRISELTIAREWEFVLEFAIKQLYDGFSIQAECIKVIANLLVMDMEMEVMEFKVTVDNQESTVFHLFATNSFLSKINIAAHDVKIRLYVWCILVRVIEFAIVQFNCLKNPEKSFVEIGETIIRLMNDEKSPTALRFSLFAFHRFQSMYQLFTSTPVSHTIKASLLKVHDSFSVYFPLTVNASDDASPVDPKLSHQYQHLISSLPEFLWQNISLANLKMRSAHNESRLEAYALLELSLTRSEDFRNLFQSPDKLKFDYLCQKILNNLVEPIIQTSQHQSGFSREFLCTSELYVWLKLFKYIFYTMSQDSRNQWVTCWNNNGCSSSASSCCGGSTGIDEKNGYGGCCQRTPTKVDAFFTQPISTNPTISMIVCEMVCLLMQNGFSQFCFEICLPRILDMICSIEEINNLSYKQMFNTEIHHQIKFCFTLLENFLDESYIEFIRKSPVFVSNMEIIVDLVLHHNLNELSDSELEESIDLINTILESNVLVLINACDSHRLILESSRYYEFLFNKLCACSSTELFVDVEKINDLLQMCKSWSQALLFKRFFIPLLEIIVNNDQIAGNSKAFNILTDICRKSIITCCLSFYRWRLCQLFLANFSEKRMEIENLDRLYPILSACLTVPSDNEFGWEISCHVIELMYRESENSDVSKIVEFIGNLRNCCPVSSNCLNLILACVRAFAVVYKSLEWFNFPIWNNIRNSLPSFVVEYGLMAFSDTVNILVYALIENHYTMFNCIKNAYENTLDNINRDVTNVIASKLDDGGFQNLDYLESCLKTRDLFAQFLNLSTSEFNEEAQKIVQFCSNVIYEMNHTVAPDNEILGRFFIWTTILKVASGNPNFTQIVLNCQLNVFNLLQTICDTFLEYHPEFMRILVSQMSFILTVGSEFSHVKVATDVSTCCRNIVILNLFCDLSNCQRMKDLQLFPLQCSSNPRNRHSTMFFTMLIREFVRNCDWKFLQPRMDTFIKYVSWMAPFVSHPLHPSSFEIELCLLLHDLFGCIPQSADLSIDRTDLELIVSFLCSMVHSSHPPPQLESRSSCSNSQMKNIIISLRTICEILKNKSISKCLIESNKLEMIHETINLAISHPKRLVRRAAVICSQILFQSLS